MIFGYVRAFAHEIDIDGQIERLERLGIARKDIRFDRTLLREGTGPQLKKLLQELAQGDVLVIDRLACLARTYAGLWTLLEHLNTKGIEFVSLQDNIDTREIKDKQFFNSSVVFEKFAEDLRKENIVFGQKSAKSLGRRGGRRSKITDSEANEIRQLIDKGMPISAIAKKYGIERTTVYRILKRVQQPPQ